MQKRRKGMDEGAQHLRSMLSDHLGPDFVQVKILYLSEHHIGFSFSLIRRRCVPVWSARTFAPGDCRSLLFTSSFFEVEDVESTVESWPGEPTFGLFLDRVEGSNEPWACVGDCWFRQASIPRAHMHKTIRKQRGSYTKTAEKGSVPFVASWRFS